MIPRKPRPYLPIAIGFYLLALPLGIAALLRAGGSAGTWTNAAAAAMLVGLGLLLHWRTS